MSAPSAPAPATLPARASLSADVLTQHVEGQAVLLDLRGDRYYSLDPVGTKVWELLGEEPDVSAVVARLLAIYDVGEAELRRDVAALLARLAAAGLVTVDG